MEKEIKKIKYNSEPEVTGDGGRPKDKLFMQDIVDVEINERMKKEYYNSFTKEQIVDDIIDLYLSAVMLMYDNEQIKHVEYFCEQFPKHKEKVEYKWNLLKYK